MNDRLYQVWYVYDDGREGCMSRPDEPMTHQLALNFRKGCMQDIPGRRLELREIVVEGVRMKVRDVTDDSFVRYEGKVYKVSKAATGFRGEGDDLPTDQVSLCGDEGTMEVDPGTEVEWMFEADC